MWIKHLICACWCMFWWEYFRITNMKYRGKCLNRLISLPVSRNTNYTSVLIHSVSVGVKFQLTKLTLFTCTLGGTFSYHQQLPLQYWHWQLFQMQFYISLALTIILHTILFQLIIAKLPSQKVYFGSLVGIHMSITVDLVANL